MSRSLGNNSVSTTPLNDASHKQSSSVALSSVPVSVYPPQLTLPQYPPPLQNSNHPITVNQFPADVPTEFNIEGPYDYANQDEEAYALRLSDAPLLPSRINLDCHLDVEDSLDDIVSITSVDNNPATHELDGPNAVVRVAELSGLNLDNLDADVFINNHANSSLDSESGSSATNLPQFLNTNNVIAASHSNPQHKYVLRPVVSNPTLGPNRRGFVDIFSRSALNDIHPAVQQLTIPSGEAPRVLDRSPGPSQPPAATSWTKCLYCYSAEQPTCPAAAVTVL